MRTHRGSQARGLKGIMHNKREQKRHWKLEGRVRFRYYLFSQYNGGFVRKVRLRQEK